MTNSPRVRVTGYMVQSDDYWPADWWDLTRVSGLTEAAEEDACDTSIGNLAFMTYHLEPIGSPRMLPLSDADEVTLSELAARWNVSPEEVLRRCLDLGMRNSAWMDRQ